MSEQQRFQGLATKAIHAGFRPDPGTGAVNAPIYASSTFAQDGVGGLRGGFDGWKQAGYPLTDYVTDTPTSPVVQQILPANSGSAIPLKGDGSVQ